MNRNLVGLDHVQVIVPPGCDEAARQFYGGVLGLEEIPMPESLIGLAICWFQCGNQELHLGFEEDFRGARKGHPCFISNDIGALKQQLRGHGLNVEEDYLLTDRDRFFAFDPWGNRLEFMQRHSQAES